MSELKAYMVYTPREGVIEGLWKSYSIRIEGAEVYLKSEADKVIEELKAQKAQTEDDCAYWKTMAQKNAADNAVMAKQRAEALKKESRHKYKRCLDMAKWCFTKSNYHFVLARHGEDVKKNNRKHVLYSKWHKRWLELADKFKEG